MTRKEKMRVKENERREDEKLLKAREKQIDALRREKDLIQQASLNISQEFRRCV